MIEQLTGRDLIGPLLREAGPALRPPPVEPSAVTVTGRGSSFEGGRPTEAKGGQVPPPAA